MTMKRNLDFLLEELLAQVERPKRTAKSRKSDPSDPDYDEYAESGLFASDYGSR